MTTTSTAAVERIMAAAGSYASAAWASKGETPEIQLRRNELRQAITEALEAAREEGRYEILESMTLEERQTRLHRISTATADALRDDPDFLAALAKYQAEKAESNG